MGAALCCGGLSSAAGTGALVGVEQTQNLNKILITVPEDLDPKDHRETGL